MDLEELTLPHRIAVCSCTRCKHFERVLQELRDLRGGTLFDSSKSWSCLWDAKHKVEEAWRNSQELSCQKPESESEPESESGLECSPLSPQQDDIAEEQHGCGCGCHDCYLLPPPEEDNDFEDADSQGGCDCTDCRGNTEDIADIRRSNGPRKRSEFSAVSGSTS